MPLHDSYSKSVCGVTIIAEENKLNDPRSNPGRAYSRLASTLKRYESISLQLWVTGKENRPI